MQLFSERKTALSIGGFRDGFERREKLRNRGEEDSKARIFSCGWVVKRQDYCRLIVTTLAVCPSTMRITGTSPAPARLCGITMLT